MEVIHVAECPDDKDKVLVTWLISKEDFQTLMLEAKEEIKTLSPEDNVGIKDEDKV